MENTIVFKHVTKRFKMYKKNSDKLLDLIFNSSRGEYHYALKDVSFNVEKGEIVGIVGLNGSGKSTLSNLIAGVTLPNEGEAYVKGTASLIAIGAGLNGNLTGVQNIELKGLMMGMSKKQIKDIMPKVIEFAEIGKFINQPVKTYSSGMKSRLGFAIAVNIDPDVLIIDEALSVGDPTFTKRCMDKMEEFKEQGKTIFFISHAIGQVREFCTTALWLHYGTVREYGEVNQVCDNYVEFLNGYNKMTPAEREKLKQAQLEENSHGLLQNVEYESRKG
ncbi:teichoic acids export ABC transporter ATP-binding subunit TagH, partial [Gottfriedia acidiceleris]|uniref:teichoic acids export ABC transporter ATP-binding subunit TagH n=1 Tax=Gottfriedia acidiceleris TaxID=371036 RepID=UPI003392E81C